MDDISEYSIRLGKIVREAREKNGYSQVKLAKEVKTSNHSVLNIENGRGNPKLELLCPLIRTLGIDPRDIFYPELTETKDSANQFRLAELIDGCDVQEAAALYPVVEAVLTAIRKRNNKK